MAFFIRYEATTLWERGDDVARIARWIEAGERVALSCYERDHFECHRSLLAEAVVGACELALTPRHL